MYLTRFALSRIAPRVLARSMGTKPPGHDPLDIIRNQCMQRNLCDELGFRRPGVHWVFSVAVTPQSPEQPPNLRVLGVQRVSSEGIDFVMQRGSDTCDSLAAGRPIAALHIQGQYLPGETAEQWRGEGHCEKLPLEEYIDLLPHYTITTMVSSKRNLKKKGELVEEIFDSLSGDRFKLLDKTETAEIMQRTRLELENGGVSDEEIADAIRPFRFMPKRLECMVGGHDCVSWNRWEWFKQEDGTWGEPTPLLPH